MKGPGLYTGVVSALVLLVLVILALTRSLKRPPKYEQAEDGATLAKNFNEFTILTLADSATYHLPFMTSGDLLTYMVPHPLTDVSIYADERNGGEWLNITTLDSTLMQFFVQPNQSVGQWIGQTGYGV